ncbi:MAG: polysaccharide biosynthesis protein [Phycisphaerae bacterium]|nr:polysaccharide biosynthesis protein [Phycisphaerae bacterium]
MFEGKRILVTGGTGSMGKVLVRRILSGEMGTPQKVIVFSRDEAKQHHMRMSYLHKQAATDEVIFNNFRQALEFRIGDVNNYDEVCSAVRGVDIVANAAALKQVPTCEYFPLQAVRTNCLGPANIVRAIREHGFPVETVIGISTDKACKPVNVMGMTKALQERILLSANVLIPDTRFICVRYGNVLASRGSVIPLFHDQIRNGGPVTITVPEMTRFLLSINQAVDLVFAALQNANAGEIYVPIIPATTVYDLAKALVGDRDMEIKEIGIRPGEKMHEIMISEEEGSRVYRRGDNYVIPSMLPELAGPDEGKDEKLLNREYSSADTVLNLEETVALLEKHNLMFGQADTSDHGELLR